MIGKRATLYAEIAESVKGAGPVTIEQIYYSLLATTTHRYDMPSKRELQGYIRQVPELQRITRKGERPTLYEYREARA